MIYFSYVHTIVSYDIIFWGNSSQNKIIFKIKKRIIRVIMNSSSRNCCCDLFKKLNILLPQSQYLISLLLFVIKNRDYLDLILKYIILVQDRQLRWSSGWHAGLWFSSLQVQTPQHAFLWRGS
jgi:hypothetical protein